MFLWQKCRKSWKQKMFLKSVGEQTFNKTDKQNNMKKKMKKNQNKQIKQKKSTQTLTLLIY
jgi:hypothetical protein